MKPAMRKRVVFWGGLGLVVALGLAAALWPQPVPVDLAIVERGPLMVTLDHEGQTRVRERFVVSAPVAGRVLRIELEPGDPVEKGKTVLATLLPSAPAMLDARSKAAASARALAAESALVRARAVRDEARAASAFAQGEARRARELAADKLVSAQQLESALADARVRAEAVAAADAGVLAAEHELAAARAALLEPATSGRAAQSPSAATVVLRAPVDGVLLRRLRESEAVVAQGEPLVEVADPAALEVIADFLSTDAVRMKPGMRVLIERWGGDAPLEGRVRRVEPSGFMKVSALGVEEQRVWVVIDFADSREAWKALGDGYRVEARVVTWERGDVLKVPASALFRHDTGWAVFVEENGVARLQSLRVGQRTWSSAEVLDGLQAGDRVIEHPSDQVTDGSRVASRKLR